MNHHRLSCLQPAPHTAILWKRLIADRWLSIVSVCKGFDVRAEAMYSTSSRERASGEKLDRFKECRVLVQPPPKPRPSSKISFMDSSRQPRNGVSNAYPRSKLQNTAPSLGPKGGAPATRCLDKQKYYYDSLHLSAVPDLRCHLLSDSRCPGRALVKNSILLSQASLGFVLEPLIQILFRSHIFLCIVRQCTVDWLSPMRRAGSCGIDDFACSTTITKLKAYTTTPVSPNPSIGVSSSE